MSGPLREELEEEDVVLEAAQTLARLQDVHCEAAAAAKGRPDQVLHHDEPRHQARASRRRIRRYSAS